MSEGDGMTDVRRIITALWAEAFVRFPHRYPRVTRFLYIRYLASKKKVPHAE